MEQAQPSVWKSYRIRTKKWTGGGRDLPYTSTYKAKPAKIQRNSAALPPSQELPQTDGGENLQEGQTEEAAAEGEVIMPFGS